MKYNGDTKVQIKTTISIYKNLFELKLTTKQCTGAKDKDKCLLPCLDNLLKTFPLSFTSN